MANFFPAYPVSDDDTSYVIRILLPLELTTSTLNQFANWRQPRVDICTPTVLITEVTSVIRQVVYRKWITAAEGQLAVEDLFRLGVRIISSDHQLCSSALTWAGRLGQSKAYDGFYFALTERVAGELWTADERLVNAARQLCVGLVHRIGEPLASE